MGLKGLILSLLAMFFWGISMFLAKPAVDRIGWLCTTVWFYIVCVLSIFIVQFFVKGSLIVSDWKGWMYAILAAITGVAGAILYNIALVKDKVSLIVVVSSLYPVITVILGLAILGEKITILQGVGIGLMIFGLVLVSL